MSDPKMDTPVWTPQHPEKSRLWAFMRFLESRHHTLLPDYATLHAWSVTNPTLFWPALCDFFSIHFNEPPHQILNQSTDMLHAHWFTGATLNFAEQLLKRNDEHPALVSVHEYGERSVLSYKALRQQVSFCAAGLIEAGIKPGDRVGAILPNVAHTIIAMLATTSIGAIWSSCSPDFGASAIIDRLGQIEPKLLFACDEYMYQGKRFNALDKLQEVRLAIPSVKHLVICPFNQHNHSPVPHAITWNNFLKSATTLSCTPYPFEHPLYILFSSGTTGKPKCIVHGAGGTLLQHVKELGLHTDITPHDNLCFYTTCGWMMWNWMVSTLALGATLTLYEGSPTYPNSYRLFELIEQENITVFGTSAKFISSIEKMAITPNQQTSLTSLRCILSTGSPLLPQHYDFVYQHIKKDVQLSSISGGTDIVSCFALGNPLTPVYRGELQCLGLGMSVDVFDEHGASLSKARGELVCTKPFPSMPIYFWNDPDKIKYQSTYFERFPGIWTHGDFAEITQHGGLIIYGRSDTVLNPGGVRIGTAEIYRQVEKIPEVVDSVAIGQDWQGDVRIVLFVKLREGLELTLPLKTHIQQVIRQHASPRHVPAKILQVTDIPRTLSGKVVELAVRQTVQGEAIQNLTSIANPEALCDFKNREELKT